MADWPYKISMESFRRAWPALEGELLWHSVFELHKDKMQIKNAHVAVANLEKIFTCTFRLASSKGFQAMSLRDLGNETGISMGGLYAYIGSKDDLASVISAVLSRNIDQVIGGVARHNLSPVQRLQAIIYGDIYMNEIMSSWYYFSFMESKGLPREKQQQAKELELNFESMLADTFKLGMAQGMFNCDDVELLASNTTHMVQQWYLKRWKFKCRKTPTETYCRFVFGNVLQSLNYQVPAVETPRLQTLA
ncbi:MAG: TetR/AcrR family transcriptional regulator [Pseudohongiellaceae bacterium]